MATPVRAHRRIAAAMLAATTLTLSACASGGSSESGSSEPIKLGLIASVGTRVDFGDVVSAAETAANGVNVRGGINGRNVEIVFCNENLDPNQGRTCARDLAGQDILAMAGSAVTTAEADVQTVMASAGIANVGPWAQSGIGASEPNNYLLTGGHEWNNAASVRCAVSEAGPRLALAVQDHPSNVPLQPLYTNGTKELGGELVANVPIPPNAGDLAPQVTQLIQSNPDAVTVQAAASLSTTVANQLQQLGYDGKWVIPDATFADKDLDALGPALNTAIFTGPFPPLSAAAQFKGLQQFEADVAAARTAGIDNLPSTRHVRAQALNAYLAVIAASEIARSANATDAESFKAAIESAKDIDLGGVVPPWTPSESVSAVRQHVGSGGMYCYHWENGTSVLDTPQPLDVTPLIDNNLK